MFSLLIPVAILTNAALNAFCSFIVYLCCIVLNYDSKPVWALFHALALTILMALSEGLIAAAIPDITIYAFRDGMPFFFTFLYFRPLQPGKLQYR